jgi:GGDEF domain-containing protein
MICSSLNLLVLMSIILRVDGLLGEITGTVYGGQVMGGDDFILLFQSQDWLQRCETLVNDFNARALDMFDAAARQAGGIEAEDRHGVMRFFPCTTVSIGAVAIDGSQYSRVEDVANLAALAKHDAKRAGVAVLQRMV